MEVRSFLLLWLNFWLLDWLIHQLVVPIFVALVGGIDNGLGVGTYSPTYAIEDVHERLPSQVAVKAEVMLGLRRGFEHTGELPLTRIATCGDEYRAILWI
jgi:hypothetical protein